MPDTNINHVFNPEEFASQKQLSRRAFLAGSLFTVLGVSNYLLWMRPDKVGGNSSTSTQLTGNGTLQLNGGQYNINSSTDISSAGSNDLVTAANVKNYFNTVVSKPVTADTLLIGTGSLSSVINDLNTKLSALTSRVDTLDTYLTTNPTTSTNTITKVVTEPGQTTSTFYPFSITYDASSHLLGLSQNGSTSSADLTSLAKSNVARTKTTTLSGNGMDAPIKADVNVSQAVNNAIEVKNDGLYVSQANSSSSVKNVTVVNTDSYQMLSDDQIILVDFTNESNPTINNILLPFEGNYNGREVMIFNKNAPNDYTVNTTADIQIAAGFSTIYNEVSSYYVKQTVSTTFVYANGAWVQTANVIYEMSWPT